MLQTTPVIILAGLRHQQKMSRQTLQTDILRETGELHMTKSEIARGFQPVWADCDTIIRENRINLTERWNIRDTEFFVWLKEQEADD